VTQIYPLSHPDALRLRRRRRVRRLILLFVAIVVLSLLAGSGQNAWLNMRQHLAMEAARKECLTFKHPSDRVVYDDDPSRARQLLASDPKYRYARFTASPNGRGIVTYSTDCADRLFKVADPNYQQLAVCPFVHARRAGQSAERLVILHIGNRKTVDSNHLEIDLGIAIARPIYALYEPDLLNQKYRLELDRDAATSVRFFGGQPDSRDESRFTVRFQVGDQDCELEARLKDDDTSELKILRAPGRITRAQ
jgi:hypothetical protein